MTDEASRARLLKVRVQPVFVMDDGISLEQLDGAPVEVAGKDWAEFAINAFGASDLTAVAEQYAAEQSEPEIT